MSTPRNTLLLDISAWDLVLDSAGNVALAKPPYSTAQDVASALRTFLGECWYDTTIGVPYWQQLLGNSPTQSQLEAALNAAALTVPGVVSAATALNAFTNRQISGQVQFTTSDGTTTTVTF